MNTETGESAVFAERSYVVKGGGIIRVVFGEPAEVNEYDWACSLRIAWPSGRQTNLSGWGVDKLDALLNAVALARLNVETRDAWLDGDVSWVMGIDAGLEAKVPDGHVEWVEEQRRSKRRGDGSGREL